MSAALQAAGATLALLATAAALLAGLAALVSTRRPAAALAVFLDLLVAAGLLRPAWRARAEFHPAWFRHAPPGRARGR